MISVLQRGWHRELISLVGSAERRLVVAAPFISEEGASLVLEAANPSLRVVGRIEILTDLSPVHVMDRSLVPEAVVRLHELTPAATLWHIPRFHAKVYIADNSRAIVTSGNLTAAAFYRNFEYGIAVNDPTIVLGIQSHFDDYRAAGTAVGIDDLRTYCSVAAEVRAAVERQRVQIDPRLQGVLDAAVITADDYLIRLRLAGGAVHTVFAKTIAYLLKKYGPLRTEQIHEFVRTLHPDLCDDSVDRVIDGRRFGKKWKHAVRTAQQQLKRAGTVDYSDPFWRTT